MSNIENNGNNENYLSEEEELKDVFILEENKNEIFKKNKYLTEKRNETVINSIINLHEKFGIKDDELFENIEKCITFKIIDFSFIKIILEFVNRTNLEEKIDILKEIYSFISNKEFKENKRINIKKIVSIIIQQNDSKDTTINFKNVLLQMKIQIIFKIFNIQDIYMQKMIIKCIQKNWNFSNIIAFQKKLRRLFPINEKKIKNQFEKMQFKTEEKRLMLASIEEFIYELNMSKKNKKEENYKESKQNFKNIYFNSKDKNQYFNGNIDIISSTFEKTKCFNLSEYLKNKISSLSQKMKNEEKNIVNQETNFSQEENDNIINNENNNDENSSLNNKVRLVDKDEKIYEKIKAKIKEIFDNKIKEIQEEIKFLAFIDYLFYETKWKNFINDLLNSYTNDEILLQEDEIKNMVNDESQQEKAIKIIAIEAEKILDNFIYKIKREFEQEGYESNKTKKFEHILIKKCSGNINYEASLEIVKQILSQNILTKNGEFNKNIFIIKRDKKEGKKERKQFVKIFFNSPYPEEIKEIKNIDDFILEETFEFNKDPLLKDVYLLYFQREYKDIDKKIFSDFTYKIKDIIIEVYNKSTENITNIFDNFFISIFQNILRKIKNNLDMDIPINESFIEAFELVEI